MLKTIVLTLGIVAGGLVKGSPYDVPTSTPRCLGPDRYSSLVLSSLKRLATSSDSVSSSIRASAKIPLVSDPAAIFVVSDSAQCAQATLTLTTDTDTVRASDVYLFKVGAVYVASNPSVSPGLEYTPQFVLDSTFSYRGMFLR